MNHNILIDDVFQTVFIKRDIILEEKNIRDGTFYGIIEISYDGFNNRKD